MFKLLSADVYDVISVEKLDDFLHPEGALLPKDAPDAIGVKTEMFGLQHVSKLVSRATDLEDLFAKTLHALHEALGFDHAMILLPDETNTRLYAIASHGYGEAGIGAEVGFGEGLIGTVARERCLLRVAGVGAELRYGRAIRESVQRAVGAKGLRPEIPLPGLVDAQSQLALPLLVGERLVGVIAIESRAPAAFEAWHEAFLEIIANQIATAIENMTLREKDEDTTSSEAPVKLVAAPRPDCGLKLRFFKNDDCVFANDEYLVRNVPGRILWKIMREVVATGRTEFSNRELRLDSTLGLPPLRDNLESRLVLLRKRLEQKCPNIQIVPVARGRFRVDVDCQIELEEAG